MIKLKSWEEMTNAERAARTFRDKNIRKERKKIGVREADSFMFNNILKAKRKRDKITSKQYRQRW